MSLRHFLRTFRAEIDAYVREVLNAPAFLLNDEDRRQWVLNDETLYLLAREKGVRL